MSKSSKYTRYKIYNLFCNLKYKNVYVVKLIVNKII